MLILFLAAFFSLRDVIPQFTTHVIVVTAGLVAGIHINAALAMLIGAAGIGVTFWALYTPEPVGWVRITPPGIYAVCFVADLISKSQVSPGHSAGLVVFAIVSVGASFAFVEAIRLQGNVMITAHRVSEGDYIHE